MALHIPDNMFQRQYPRGSEESRKRRSNTHAFAMVFNYHFLHNDEIDPCNDPNPKFKGWQSGYGTRENHMTCYIICTECDNDKWVTLPLDHDHFEDIDMDLVVPRYA